MTGFMNKLQTKRMGPLLMKQVCQPIPSNTKVFVVELSTELAKWFQFSSREQQVRTNLLLLWRERTLHKGLSDQEKSQHDQDVRGKKFENVAADEEQYEPTDDENIKGVGFDQKGS